MVKNQPANAGDVGWSLGQKYPMEKEMATHSGILALKIPMGKGAYWVTVHGVAESDLTFSLWNMSFFTLLFHPHQEVRPETIKLLEENIGRTLDGINQSKILYDPPSRVMEIKAKVNKWDLIKLKKFCTAKESISKVTRTPSEWEKIIANETIDKGLISKICKQLIQLNTRKTNNPKNWEKDLNRHFSKEDIQMANKHIQKCSLIIREMKTKIAMRYHLTLVRMAIIKKPTNSKYWRGCGEKGTIQSYSHYGRWYGDSLKKLGIKLLYDPAIPLLGIFPEENKIGKTYVSHCSLQHCLQ